MAQGFHTGAEFAVMCNYTLVGCVLATQIGHVKINGSLLQYVM